MRVSIWFWSIASLFQTFRTEESTKATTVASTTQQTTETTTVATTTTTTTTTTFTTTAKAPSTTTISIEDRIAAMFPKMPTKLSVTSPPEESKNSATFLPPFRPKSGKAIPWVTKKPKPVKTTTVYEKYPPVTKTTKVRKLCISIIVQRQFNPLVLT